MDHVSHESDAIDNARPTIHQVTQEDSFSPLRMRPNRAGPDTIVLGFALWLVPQQAKKLLQLIAAAMRVPDDVERTMLGLAVVP